MNESAYLNFIIDRPKKRRKSILELVAHEGFCVVFHEFMTALPRGQRSVAGQRRVDLPLWPKNRNNTCFFEILPQNVAVCKHMLFILRYTKFIACFEARTKFLDMFEQPLQSEQVTLFCIFKNGG